MRKIGVRGSCAAVTVALALHASPVTSATQTVTYAYDALGRLAGATYDGVVTATYTYDACGNIMATTVESGPVSVDGGPPSLARLELAPAAPNPFSGDTALRFELPAAGRARLVVYDLAGRRVRTLVESVLAAGRHVTRWDGRDEAGRLVGSGLFLARLETGAGARTRRIIRLGAVPAALE
jgi:YD repeat-containing protein